jgi:2-(1,2-epoxy-1,2-dihydrophenyl)acetyl-CoA isomerase
MPDLIEKIQDGVAVLTMNRPEAMNALSPDMLNMMVDSLSRLGGDDSVGCVVIRGAGERAFCAGGDVKAMASGERSGYAPFETKVYDLRRRMESSRLLHDMPKPTIAMVNGVAAGAGLSLALACDMRIAARSARMTTAFIKVGFSGDFGGKYFMQKLIGSAKTRELYFTSDILNSEQIEKLGLVNRVVDDAKLESETMTLAKRIAAGPRLAYFHMKRDMKIAEEGSLVELLDAEAQWQTRTGETEDHKEASKAFVEKRTATFKGR